MQKEIKKIRLCLENCEAIEIDGGHLGKFLVDDIKQSIKRVACNSIMAFNKCKTLVLSIHRNENQYYSIFGSERSSYTKFERLLAHKDIVSIVIEYSQEAEKEIYVDWRGDDYSNPAQKVYLSKSGDLFVVLSDEKQILDFFDLSVIDDKDKMNSEWKMYS